MAENPTVFFDPKDPFMMDTQLSEEEKINVIPRETMLKTSLCPALLKPIERAFLIGT